MSGKVTVTKEVSEAIEHLCLHCRIDRLMKYLDGELIPSHPKVQLAINELDKEALLHAIFYGYEIEKTPADSLREFYVDLRKSKVGSVYSYQADAVEVTLNLLKLKIEGVNVE